MEFLTTQELETITLRELAMYRSLLEQMYSLDTFGSSQLGIKIGEVRDLIVKRVKNGINEYLVNGIKYNETALVKKEDKGLDIFGKVYEEFINANADIKKGEIADAISTQKSTLIEGLLDEYLNKEYPVEMIKKQLGLDIIDRITGGNGKEERGVVQSGRTDRTDRAGADRGNR